MTLRTLMSFTVHKDLLSDGQILAISINGVVDEYAITRIEPILGSDRLIVHVRLMLPPGDNKVGLVARTVDHKE